MAVPINPGESLQALGLKKEPRAARCSNSLTIHGVVRTGSNTTEHRENCRASPAGDVPRLIRVALPQENCTKLSRPTKPRQFARKCTYQQKISDSAIAVATANYLSTFIYTYECSLAESIGRIHANADLKRTDARFVVLAPTDRKSSYVQCVFREDDRNTWSTKRRLASMQRVEVSRGYGLTNGRRLCTLASPATVRTETISNFSGSGILASTSRSPACCWRRCTKLWRPNGRTH